MESWKFTGLYGHPVAVRRYESWALLRHLGSFMPNAWLSMGDYNEILEDREKVGGRRRPRGQMEAFQYAIEDCQLADLGFVGPHYTWNNGQEK